MAISETDGVVTYSEHLAAWARVFVGVLGAVMAVLGPVTMISIAVPLWTLSFLLAVFTGIALFLFGLLALTIAFSATARLEFRMPERVLVVSKRGPLSRSRVEHGFAAVSGPSFAMRDSEDGAFPVLGLRIDGERYPLEMTGFADAEEARFWQARLATILSAIA